MRRIRLTAQAACAALCIAFGNSGAASAAEWIYVVTDGDNLWNLSERYLHGPTYWKRVQRLNRIPDGDAIRPGTRLRIPLEWIVSNGVPARVRALRGEAWIHGTDGRRSAEPGSLLQLGERLDTGADATAAIGFADGSVVTVLPSSSVAFDHLSAHGETGMVDTRLRLLGGRLESRVTPASGPGSRFEIHTASAISAVRGTEYRMAVVNDRQASSVEVTGGTVGVSGDRPEQQSPVEAGFGTLVEAGKPPTPPRPLLAGPVADPLPAVLDRLGWPVAWNAVDGAVRYRAELSDRADFLTTRWSRLTDAPRVRLPELPDGSYHLRLRAIDELGIEGLDAVLAVTQDARPEPPSPLQPADGHVTREEAPQLAWSRSLDAARYRLEVARDEAFSELLHVVDGLEALEFRDASMAVPGRYYWRLRSVAADGEIGPLGAVRRFEVKPIPATPEPAVVADESRLTLSWRAGMAGESYQVQLASDPAFAELLLDEARSEPTLTLEQLRGQTRYFRVRTVDAEGYPGPWAGVQELKGPPVETPWAGLLGSLLLFLLIAL